MVSSSKESSSPSRSSPTTRHISNRLLASVSVYHPDFTSDQNHGRPTLRWRSTSSVLSIAESRTGCKSRSDNGIPRDGGVVNEKWVRLGILRWPLQLPPHFAAENSMQNSKRSASSLYGF
ncbi:hypothetical protein C1H46_021637 [Malus baccata]|uniref:Uncharacterized protein n=1 Tax=Malus baccata TaxID=106549 RepID=A0A540M2J5_MALBA|nr:hypothetical protein C1H46_021637 [Malus baccata]